MVVVVECDMYIYISNGYIFKTLNTIHTPHILFLFFMYSACSCCMYMCISVCVHIVFSSPCALLRRALNFVLQLCSDNKEILLFLKSVKDAL